MVINLDLKLLENIGLSADEFTALYLIFRKGYNYFETIKLEVNWAFLEEEGYLITENKTFPEYEVTDKFKGLFSNNFDNMFSELIDTYPMKVDTRNGIRILHAKDPHAKSNLKAKNRYRKIVGNKAHVHNRILFLLQKQLKIDSDNLAYLQNLETWINNHTWEKYEDIDCENEYKNKPQRITRSL